MASFKWVVFVIVTDVYLGSGFTENATIEPSVVQAALSTSAMFTCTSDGIPSSSFTWTRLYSANERRETGNGVKIVSAGSSSTLTIDRVDYTHYGMYQCEARDPRHPRQNVAYATGILVAPYFRILPAPSVMTIPAKIEEKVVLACPVFGFPRPAIKWRYPDGNTKEDLLANILFFTMQKADDFGEYSCSAGDEVFTFMVENTAQSSDCSNLITAIIILVVVLMLSLVVILVLSVKLYKAQFPSSDCITESVVTIILVVILILALVVILVQAQFPSSDCITEIAAIIILVVMLVVAFVPILVLSLKLYKVPPGRPRITLTDEDIQATSLIVRWSAPADNGGSPVTGYRVVIRLQESGDIVNEVTLGNVLQADFGQLEISTGYTVEVSAINAAGAGQPGLKDFTTKSQAWKAASPLNVPRGL